MSAVPGSATVPIVVEPLATGRPGAAGARGTSVSAARGGAQLLAAAVISLLANYTFLLVAGRLLGTADYGTLAALAGLLTVVLLPTGALQMAVSREISRREALGERDEAASFARAILVLGIKVSVPLLLVAFALMVPLREMLRLEATAPLALALTVLAGVFAYPIALGVLQGQQRFRALAFNSAAPMVARLLLFAAFAAAGFRLYGALGAVVLSTLAGVVVTLFAVRGTLRAARTAAAPSLRPFLRYLLPVAVGLFGIAVLTNADILVVKARFSAEEAGVYAAASAFARVGFFLPATILAVLFPRTAARQARGEQSDDILGRSVIVTVAFCAVLAAAYALVGENVVRLTFGVDFAAAGDLLVPFCLAVTCFSVANVLLGYHLSRGESRFAWIVAGSVVVQLTVLATLPGTLREVLWADVAVGVALLAVHELTMGSSAKALVAGYRCFGIGAAARRAVARLARARSAAVEAIIVVAGYSVVAVATTWPLARSLGSAMLGPFPNDGSGGAAWFWQLHQEDGYQLAGLTHHTVTGAPVGWEQGSALNYQWFLPDYPGFLLAGVIGEIAAINIVTLGGLALSGAAMYLLVRSVGCGRLVASWAGLVYLVFPWQLERAMAGHPTLVHLWAFPLLVLAGIAWVRKPSDGRALLVGLTVVAAWLTSGYFGTMALIALLGITGVGVYVLRRTYGWRSTIGRTAKVWAMAVVFMGGITITAIIVGGTGGISIGRNSADIEYYRERLRDFLPDPANRFAGALTPHLRDTSGYFPGAENMLYPGVLTVALALLWLVVAARRWTSLSGHTRIATLVFTAVGLVATIVALPSPLRIGGLTLQPMPSQVVFEVLPSFRVPSRLIVVAMVGLVGLAAFGLSHVVASTARRFGSSRASNAVAIGVCGAACAWSILELAPLPLEISKPGPLPSVYAGIGQAPAGVLAEYPLTRAGTALNSEYIYWQRLHGRPLLNSAGENTDADSVRRMLVDPRAPGTAPSLALLGVTAIVTRPTTLDWRNGTTPGDPRNYGPGLRLRSSSPDARAWQVTASPAPALAAYGAGGVDEPLVRGGDGSAAYPLLDEVVQIDLYAKAPGLWRLRFDSRLRSGRATLRIDGSTGSHSFPVATANEISVPILVPRGRSAVTLTVTREGATPNADPGDVTLSPTWFESPRTGDRRGAVVPFIRSTEPGF